VLESLFDPDTAEELSEFVDVGQEGEIVSFAWVKHPREAHPSDKPFAWAMIKLDGADVPMVHWVKADSEDAVSTGAPSLESQTPRSPLTVSWRAGLKSGGSGPLVSVEQRTGNVRTSRSSAIVWSAGVAFALCVEVCMSAAESEPGPEEAAGARTETAAFGGGGSPVARVDCNPLGRFQVKVAWVEANLGGEHTRRGRGKMRCATTLAKGGPTTVKATLAFGTRPGTLKLTNKMISQILEAEDINGLAGH